MSEERKIENALKVGWGYNEKGQLFVIVPHFSKNEEFFGNMDDGRIINYLGNAWDESSICGCYADYDDFMNDEDSFHDADLYKLDVNGLVETNGVLYFNNPKLQLNDDSYDKASLFLDGKINVATELNTELKIGDLRYDVNKKEAVLIVPAPKYLYDRNDEPNSLVVIMSLQAKQLISFLDKDNAEVIVLDQETLNSDKVKSAYPYLITRNPSDIIK